MSGREVALRKASLLPRLKTDWSVHLGAPGMSSEMLTEYIPPHSSMMAVIWAMWFLTRKGE